MGKKQEPYDKTGKHYVSSVLTLHQVLRIKEEFPYYKNRELSEKYGVSRDTIIAIGNHYSVYKISNTGRVLNNEPIDTVMFDWFYPKLSNKKMGEIFNRSDNTISRIGRKRGLEKDKYVLSSRLSKTHHRIKYKDSGEHINIKGLSEEDILYIIKSYPTHTDRHIFEKTGCTKSKLKTIVDYYEIKKDEKVVRERRKRILTKRNKEVLGRDLTVEFISEQAKKYQTKTEFYYNDPSAYSSANKLGIMEDITKHMVNLSFSIPQIILRQITESIFKEKCKYNTRRVIKPYEIDVYFENLKIGFEYDGKGWHKEDVVDKHKLCEEKGILLLTLSERSRNYKEDIQNYLLEELDKIVEWTGLNITPSDIKSFNEPIDFPRLFTEEELELLNSKSVTYLRSNHLNLYERYKRYNPDNKEFTNIKYTEDIILEEISKYKSEGELLKGSPLVYSAIHSRFRHLLPIYGKGIKIPIRCIETNEEFESITEASKKLGVSMKNIRKVLDGENKSASGLSFEIINIK